MSNHVPLIDLAAIHIPLSVEFHEALDQALKHSRFIGGADVENFEKEFSAFAGCTHTVACGNGTDAIEMALVELLGQGAGNEEIITPSHTFIATTEAISKAGYRPVFADVDPETFLLDPQSIESKITSRTRAIVPVHIYGQMVAMDIIMSLAKTHNLKVIEDAAQAHGATYKGSMPGQLSDGATFSFYPGKNLGALGDAGAFVTNNSKLAERVRMRANHGRVAKYEHEFEGQNSRLDSLQAAFLRIKLKHLKAWNEERRQIAKIYDRAFEGHPGIVRPKTQSQCEHVYHWYVIKVEHREKLMKALKSEGIETGIHYPIPLHMQPAYKHLNVNPESLPHTLSVSGKILSLPIFPGLKVDVAEWVAQRVKYHVSHLAQSPELGDSL